MFIVADLVSLNKYNISALLSIRAIDAHTKNRVGTGPTVITSAWNHTYMRSFQLTYLYLLSLYRNVSFFRSNINCLKLVSHWGYGKWRLS